MNKRNVKVWIATLAVAVLAGAYMLGRAEAEGIPVMEPLAYSGTLVESGVLVNGTRNVGLTIWTDAVSTSGAALACTTSSRPIAVTEGRFRLVLDATCVAAIANNPDVWVEVSIAGAPMPREHVGAVPYAVEAANGVPAGTVVSFAGEAIPAGWLLCDGRALRRSEHAGLFAAIGTAWGNGSADTDPTTDFNLPDLRGRFVRGADGATGRDPDVLARAASAPGGNAGDRVGSMQSDATALPSTPFVADTAGAHTHTWNGYNNVAGSGSVQVRARGVYGGDPTDPVTNGAGAHTHTISGGDSETRPANAYVTFVIRD